MPTVREVAVEARFESLLGSAWRAATATVGVFEIGPFGVAAIDVETFPTDGMIDGSIRYFVQLGPPPPHPQQLEVTLFVELPEGLGFDRLSAWGVYDSAPPSWWAEDQLPGDLVHDALLEADPETMLRGLFGFTSAPFIIRPSQRSSL